MSFNLSSNARSYFREIEKKSSSGKFDSLWDKYYLSAMAGIKARKRVPDEEEPKEAFNDEIIQDYEDQKFEIFSSLIVAEIDRKGISWVEQGKIRELALNLLDSTSHTHLSEDGEKVLNCYAQKGFELLQNEIPTQSELDEFLESYHKFLSELE